MISEPQSPIYKVDTTCSVLGHLKTSENIHERDGGGNVGDTSRSLSSLLTAGMVNKVNNLAFLQCCLVPRKKILPTLWHWGLMEEGHQVLSSDGGGA